MRTPGPARPRQLRVERLAAGDPGRLEARTGGERELALDAAAPGMQGADRCVVQFGQRDVEPLQCRGTRAFMPGQLRVQPGFVGFVCGGRERAIAGQGLRPAQALAQAALQFGGGGLAEGGDDDLARRQALLQQQAQVEHGDGPGLACAGTGLDQAAAIALQRQAAPVDAAHAGAPASVWASAKSIKT